MITGIQGAGLWTLANHLGHEWAGDEADRDDIWSSGWDAVSGWINAQMEASRKEQSDARSSLPAGIWPDTSHTTGSGRLSWYCRSYGNAVVIEVNRPAATGLRGSNIVVLRLSAEYLAEGGWMLTDCESVPELIELRHIQAMAEALFGRYNSVDEQYLSLILLEIGDYAMSCRIRQEIEVEQLLQARQEALEAEQDRLEA